MEKIMEKGKENAERKIRESEREIFNKDFDFDKIDKMDMEFNEKENKEEIEGTRIGFSEKDDKGGKDMKKEKNKEEEIKEKERKESEDNKKEKREDKEKKEREEALKELIDIFKSIENKEKGSKEIKLRKYQESILNTAKQKNTLVVLPTGLGKTIIAFALIDFRLKYFGGKALFLAPTRPLVDQHYTNFKKNFNWESHILTGAINKNKRKEIWEKAKVVFATPQTIANDLKLGIIDLKDVTCLVVDEAHRCLKNYDYVYVAKRYSKEAIKPRTLGLTASPSEEKNKIQEICKNLDIDTVEVRTRESPDVKPYIKKVKIKIIKVALGEDLINVRSSFEEIYKKKLEELSNRGFLFKTNPTKKELIELQKRLQRMAGSSANFNIMKSLTAIAIVLKLQHAIELLETQSIKALYLYLNDLYEQAKDKKSKAVIQLVNKKEFQNAFLKVLEFYNKGKEHPKLEKLKEILEEELRLNKSFKAIIFTQVRDNVVKIKEFLDKSNISSAIFVGQAKKRNTGLSQKEQKRIIEEFSLGMINVLIATSVGEEGLDLPEVDAVIFYEPIPSAIRKIQRAGRTARTKEGKIIILITEKTRDEAYYWAAWHKEKKMYKLINEINKKLNKNREINLTLDKFLKNE